MHERRLFHPALPKEAGFEASTDPNMVPGRMGGAAHDLLNPIQSNPGIRSAALRAKTPTT